MNYSRRKEIVTQKSPINQPSKIDMGVNMNKNEDRLGDVHSYGLDLRNREVFLHNKEAEENPGVDYRMAISFLKNIRILETQNSQPITIHMQSIGGEWYSGMGIYDTIKSCKSPTKIIAYNQAESMSSIILQAADKRVLMPNCLFMCHYGSTDLSGDYLSSHNFAAIDKINMQNMVDIYAERCHKKGKYFKEREDSLSKVKSYIKRKMKDGDWYLNPEDAVRYGFADAIFSKK